MIAYFHGITITINIWDNMSVFVVSRKGQILRLIEQFVKKEFGKRKKTQRLLE